MAETGALTHFRGLFQCMNLPSREGRLHMFHDLFCSRNPPQRKLSAPTSQLFLELCEFRTEILLLNSVMAVDGSEDSWEK